MQACSCDTKAGSKQQGQHSCIRQHSHHPAEHNGCDPGELISIASCPEYSGNLSAGMVLYVLAGWAGPLSTHAAAAAGLHWHAHTHVCLYPTLAATHRTGPPGMQGCGQVVLSPLTPPQPLQSRGVSTRQWPRTSSVSQTHRDQVTLVTFLKLIMCLILRSHSGAAAHVYISLMCSCWHACQQLWIKASDAPLQAELCTCMSTTSPAPCHIRPHCHPPCA